MSTDRPCRYCNAPLVWRKNPEGKWMPCDPTVRQLVADDGTVVTGRVSHWDTCPHAEQARRAAAEKRGEKVPERVPPRKVEAVPPASASTTQLALPGAAAAADDPVLRAARALASATTVGHYDGSIRASIETAVRSPRHQLDVHIRSVTSSEVDQAKACADHARDLERLRCLGELEVAGQRVFRMISRADLRSDQNIKHGVAATLKLHPAIVAKFLAPLLGEREPGAEG